MTNLRALGLSLVAWVLFVPLACSQSAPMPGGLQSTGSGGPPGAGGGGGGGGSDIDAASVDIGDTGVSTTGTCTSLTLTTVGPCETVKPSAAPMPIGGTIVGTTYGLSTVNHYEGADASVQTSTCDIRYELTLSSGTSGTVQLAYELGQQDLVYTASGTYSTSGNVLTFVFNCETFQSGPVTPTTAYAAYTAEGTDLRLYGAPLAPSLMGLDLTTEYVFGPR